MNPNRPSLAVPILVAVFGFSNQCAAENLVMPQELVQFAGAKGCSQVDDFFARPGMIDPPYVYGYAPGDEEDSAVFWCQRQMNGKRQYVLQFMYKKKVPASGCADYIVWPNPPRGLSLVKSDRLTSDYFVYLDDRTSPPKGIPFAGPAILSTYDGVSAWFYCHQGRWLVRQTH